MVRKDALQTMERKVFRSHYQDGLLDLFLGLIMAQVATAPLLSEWGMGNYWSASIWLAVYITAMFVISRVKRNVVRPRLGRVKYSPERRARIRRFTRGAAAMGVIMFMTGFAVFIRRDIQLSDWTFVLVMAGGLFLVFFLLGVWLHSVRFVFYGIWMAAASFTGEWLYRHEWTSHHGFPLGFGTSSLLLIASGIVLFTRFLKENPSPKDEENHD
jgi:hypothetical protein